MSTTLVELYHSPDILSHVFSFLPLESIAMMERSCKHFATLLRADYIDKTIYYHYICQLFKLDPSIMMKDDDTSLLHMFDQFLQEENCRELLIEFFRAPFIGNRVENNDPINSYSNKGGVIDFSIYVPCKLLRGLLSHCKYDLDENIKRTLHKFLLFAGVSYWTLEVDSKFQLAKLNSNEVFTFRKNPYSSNSFPFTQYSMGKGLIMLLNNNFKEIDPEFSLAISLSGPEDSVILYNELIRNAEPPEMWDDIFSQCSNPPYSMQPANEEIQALTSQLYNDHDGSCEHYCWNDFLLEDYSSWSSYWLAGAEWWGCYSLTTYDYSKQQFVIATASTTD
ncbi:Hypothetical protein NAEGRDRAFT_63529 [Naegleria gruberi]|uniref:F-box domain-containing protein n=1 Tax=Naegleria gruberi TaxID=5762 RepID=D2V3Y1_NAEGR|nr:uncharacterized protein NAEGRDRAFT_63529 [Naegleria gruberi]EFC48280.1 Hypothetical protein NAEGRDRAFT_63529 [Naegleria gruberi]|eukprot:XP_002681024.1 Hypothetical protein NAEGRDRAFT_63529 [Naegleria gruberi strain NEG-M]